MKMSQTKVTIAGVLRCCPTSFDEADPNAEVKIGDKENCKYCKETFTLIDHQNKPIWLPDWQTVELPK